MFERVDAHANALGAGLRLPRAELSCVRAVLRKCRPTDREIGSGRGAPRALKFIERSLHRRQPLRTVPFPRGGTMELVGAHRYRARFVQCERKTFVRQHDH